MKILKDLLDKIYYFDNKAKWIVWLLIIIIFLLILYIGIFRNTGYYSRLFYPDINSAELVVEKRLIIKKNSTEDQIREIIEELMVGPISPDINNPFSKEAKLLSCWVIDDVVFLNLNREAVLNIDSKLIKLSKGYHLFLESFVDTICFQFKKIKSVKIFIDGKEYNYLDNYPLMQALKPDWEILKR